MLFQRPARGCQRASLWRSCHTDRRGHSLGLVLASDFPPQATARQPARAESPRREAPQRQLPRRQTAWLRCADERIRIQNRISRAFSICLSIRRFVVRIRHFTAAVEARNDAAESVAVAASL